VHGRTLPLLLLVAVFAACDPAAPPPAEDASAPPAANDFDEAACGTVTGCVVWDGELPQVPPYRAPANPVAEMHDPTKRLWPNPNLPDVDAKSQGVKDAMVFLRGVDPAKARPWDHPPVRVEFRDDELFVVQGDYAGRRGFVRRGDCFEVVSKRPAFEALQARGAAFFNLTLPDANQVRSRRLDHAGVVELSSGAGRFWMRGHVFVVDHPYFTRTDAAGRFTLPKVPPGKYELVCWHPNWHEEVREHDADSYCISRLTFRPAAEVVREIEVRRGDSSDTTFHLSVKDFPH
jgi:hypothetical protein